MKAIIK